MNKKLLCLVLFLVTLAAGIGSAYLLLPARRLVNAHDLPAATPIKVLPPVPPPAVAVNPADLAVLKRFAERYVPWPGIFVSPLPPFLKGRTLRALQSLIQSGTREHEKYVVLIVLRVCRFEVENFAMTSDLNDGPEKNPLTEEFFRLMNYQHAELDQSYLAEEWVKKNPRLREYQPIQNEMLRIERAWKKHAAQFQRNSEERDRQQKRTDRK